MRWHVSRNGKSCGPFEEFEVIVWASQGMVDIHVRDDAGGPWLPIAESSFRSYLPHGIDLASTAPEPLRPSLSSTSDLQGTATSLPPTRIPSQRFEFMRRPSRGSRWALGSAVLIAGIACVGFAQRAELRHLLRKSEAHRAPAASVAKATRESPLGTAHERRIVELREELAVLKQSVEGQAYTPELQHRVRALEASAETLRKDIGQHASRADFAQLSTDVLQVSSKMQARQFFVELTQSARSHVEQGKAEAGQRQWLSAHEHFESALRDLGKALSLPEWVRLLHREDLGKARREAEILQASIADPVTRERARVERRETEKRERDAYLRDCGDPPISSSEDGGFDKLELQLAPADGVSSIDVSNCTKPTLSDKTCWVSVCNVSRQDAFGRVNQRIAYSFSTRGVQVLK